LLKVKDVKPVVWQEASAWQKLADDLDAAETREGIRRGLADVEAGRVITLEEFKANMEARFPFLRKER
jgi:predicted transcriptional regulator